MSDNNNIGDSFPPESNFDDQMHLRIRELPQTFLSRKIDAFLKGLGSAISWVWPILIGVIVLNVTMRYAFGEGRIEFEELQWHLYAVGFLVGLSFALESDSHVRVDLIYENLSLPVRAWIELFGILIFLMPFLVLVTWYTVPFLAYSFSVSEVSDAPGGLPGRWAIKSALLIGFILLIIGTFSRLSRVTAFLFGFPKLPIDSARLTLKDQ